ncbi:MAG: 2,3-bisphosphoglycerate-independent phosphoglycerate mutase [Bacteroidetes bacterium]|nr:2,3-bisphosphoglycerate-independent phosphoglycerate mutase [Bacteroidota bacterium]
MKNKVFLMILDGWGNGDKSKSDVIFNGDSSYLKKLESTYPTSQLLTSGENVGLPDGQMGNSEVGHLNLGAGRIVYQDLVKINKACADNSIASNPVIVEAMRYAAENNKAVHFIGLLSNGGVHSLDTHVYKLTDVATEAGVKNVFVHAFTDGRDTDPRSGKAFIASLEKYLVGNNAQLASIIGRFYAMDRDKRWERVRIAYDMLVKGEGTHAVDSQKAIQDSYDAGVTDEFIKPVVMVDENDKPRGVISDGDVVFSFNYRSDRGREITMVLAEDNIEGMTKIPNVKYLTMTPYDEGFKNVSIVYNKDNIKNTLGETIANAGLTQLHIAETEKYAHVTFFFNGGREAPYKNENRVLVSSPKVATYDLQPEMSAPELRDAVIKEMKESKPDFICLNFANGDMVGHTGVYDAILKAVATINSVVESVVNVAKEEKYTILICADHGNADYALNPDGTPNTAHSLNPVPFIVVSDEVKSVKSGVLADVAPTILNLMGVDIPEDMTGHILV